MNSSIVFPIATGMSLAMSMLAMKKQKPTGQYVLWCRIDQKSCFKSILTAGLTPIVVPNILKEGEDELSTNLKFIEDTIKELTPEKVLCVYTTTSCFAPRARDSVIEVSQICKANNVYHLINNAYGIQDTKCCHVINEACRLGQVDIVVQSTDKNFMVPVGGAILCSPDKEWIERVSKLYPGRASASSVIDLFITLLSMGSNKYLQMRKDRKDVHTYLKTSLTEIAKSLGERVLETPNNSISVGMTLSSIMNDDPAAFGSMIYSRGCSGIRVVVPGVDKSIDGVKFKGHGGNHDNYPVPYFTIAASIGLTKDEVDICISRVRKTLLEYKKQLTKKKSSTQDKKVKKEENTQQQQEQQQ
eukprot:TRINITY_DN3312_c0_g1_i1.p1 TRINITY_DN3312_c0_g1~~TRINITY_DN3312_c0_g1_i1.p1  ORF type:complete len:358 (+),score=69.82 TRINITY_DN3312_c0_g1_i1:672-1745(+)